MAHKTARIEPGDDQFAVFEIGNASAIEADGTVQLSLFGVTLTDVPQQVFDTLREAGFHQADIDDAMETLYNATLARALAKRMRRIG